MTENETSGENPSPLPETAEPKRGAYEKPAFRHERVFETAALSCGKIAGTSWLCNSSRKVS
jgi:hypothetical protein